MPPTPTRPQRSWTITEHRRAVALRRAGTPVAVIARKLRRTVCSVKSRLQSDGIVICTAWRTWTGGERVRLGEMKAAGMTARQIGVALNRPIASIYKALHRFGMSRRILGRRSRGQLIEAVRRLMREGCETREICDRLGLGRTTVLAAKRRVKARRRAGVVTLANETVTR